MVFALNKKPGGPSMARAKTGRDVAARLDRNPLLKRARVEGADIFVARDFLNDADCAMLIGLIDKGRRPSTLLSQSSDPNFRTSESCDLDRWAPAVRAIDERIATLLGIQPEYGETMQGQRYAVGQQFRPHYDWFHENEAYWPAMRACGGQRTWTAMIYLNEVEEGGATWFPNAGIRVAPKRGTLLTWNNMAADGSPNSLTLHEGTAVVAGTKYVVTKWFRENRWLN